eukprot:2926831-Prymnesium_polylepis.1
MYAEVVAFRLARRASLASASLSSAPSFFSPSAAAAPVVPSAASSASTSAPSSAPTLLEASRIRRLIASRSALS